MSDLRTCLLGLAVMLAGCQAPPDTTSPAHDGVAPASGQLAGGTLVTITGNNFPEDAAVLFGARLAPNVEWVGPDQLEVVSPEASSGTVDVTVMAGARVHTRFPTAFTFSGQHTVVLHSLSPGSGPREGGTDVVLRGAGFHEGLSVRMCGVTVDPHVVSPLSATFVTPPCDPGEAWVSVESDGGSDSLDGAFHYTDDRLALHSVRPDTGPAAGGTRVTVQGTGFEPDTTVYFGDRPATLVVFHSETEVEAVAPPGTGNVAITVAGRQGNQASLPDGFVYQGDTAPVGGHDDNQAPVPRLLSVTATSPTTVVANFEFGLASSATQPARQKLRIVGAPASYLKVYRISRSSDGRTLTMTTSPMSDAEYELKPWYMEATGGSSNWDEPVAGPDGVLEYNRARFRGVPESGEPTDTDMDGVSDADEAAGYHIRIHRTNGRVEVRHVSSSLNTSDTDEDGIPDADERAEGTDPRNDDTDGDTLKDFDELLRFQSNANHQDTDEDGLNDPTERFFRTSLVLPDSDGDQFSDYEEVIERGRNPRVADLPRPEVEVGRVNIVVDNRYSYTDSRGVERSEERSFATGLAQGSENASTESSSSTTSAFLEGGIELGMERELGAVPSTSVSVAFSVAGGAGFEKSFGTERASATSSLATYNESIAFADTVSADHEVTREVVGASVSVSVTLKSRGDVSFTLANIELSLLRRDSQNPRQLTPVASLHPASEDLEVNLGPLFPERGPFVFTGTDVFPQQAEALMRDPSLLVVKVANYDVLDEEGRNLSFVSQRVAELAGTIIINYGNGVEEQITVAAHSEYDPKTGEPVGIRLTEALEAAGLQADGGCVSTCRYSATPIADHDDCPANRSSCRWGLCRPQCSSDADCEGGSLCSIHWGATKGVCFPECQADSDCVEGHCHSTVRGLDGHIKVCLPYYEDQAAAQAACNRNSADTNSYGTRVDGRELRLTRVRDVVADGAVQTPAQGEAALFNLVFATIPIRIHEFARRAWVVFDGTGGQGPGGRGAAPTSDISSTYLLPGHTILLANTRDRDGDGLWEIQELAVGTSDLDGDSDNDFLTDFHEVNGLLWWPVGAEDISDTTCSAISEYDSPGDWAATCVNRVTTDTHFGGYRVFSDPTRRDTDGDGISDLYESIHGVPGSLAPLDPRKRDTDEDGLDDLVESEGATDPLDADTDDDGLTDGFEVSVGLDPLVPDADRFIDSDFDGLTEAQEDVGVYVAVCRSARTRRDGQRGWSCQGPGTSVRKTSDDDDGDSDDDGLADLVEYMLGTDPTSADTDGDGLSDRDEWDHVVQYDTIVTACRQHAGCEVPDPAASARLGTVPWRADTDGDGLSDGIELGGWTVTLLGPGGDDQPLSVQVNSDPLVADSDGDGLNDYHEYTFAGGRLNPRNTDTDGDGLADSDENSRVDDFGRARHPLRPDRRVVIRYSGEQGRQLGGHSDTNSDGMSLRVEIHTRNQTFPLFTPDQHQAFVRGATNLPERDCTDQEGEEAIYWSRTGHWATTSDANEFASAVLTLGYGEEASVFGSVSHFTYSSYSCNTDSECRDEGEGSCSNHICTNHQRTDQNPCRSYQHNHDGYCQIRRDLPRKTSGRADCGTATRYFFGGEGRTPDELRFDGSITEPVLLSFGNAELRPACQGDSCPFSASWSFRVEPVTQGNGQAVRGDFRLTSPDTGRPVTDATTTSRVEYFDGERWGLICGQPNVIALPRHLCERRYGRSFDAPVSVPGSSETLYDLPFNATTLSGCGGPNGYDIRNCQPAVSDRACDADDIFLINCDAQFLPHANTSNEIPYHNTSFSVDAGERRVFGVNISQDVLNNRQPLYLSVVPADNVQSTFVVDICLPGQSCEGNDTSGRVLSPGPHSLHVDYPGRYHVAVENLGDRAVRYQPYLGLDAAEGHTSRTGTPLDEGQVYFADISFYDNWDAYRLNVTRDGTLTVTVQLLPSSGHPTQGNLIIDSGLAYDGQANLFGPGFHNVVYLEHDDDDGVISLTRSVAPNTRDVWLRIQNSHDSRYPPRHYIVTFRID